VARTRKLYNFDPDEARRLLKLAGVESLNLRLDFSQSEEHLSAALVVQAQLASMESRFEVRSMDTASFIADDRPRANPPDSEVAYPAFHDGGGSELGSAMVHLQGDRQCWNFERRCSPAWDSLSEAAVGELDLTKRAADYETLQTQLEEGHGRVCISLSWTERLDQPVLPSVGAWTPDGKIPLCERLPPSRSEVSNGGVVAAAGRVVPMTDLYHRSFSLPVCASAWLNR